jgi:VWFA-related protein
VIAYGAFDKGVCCGQLSTSDFWPGLKVRKMSIARFAATAAFFLSVCSLAGAQKLEPITANATQTGNSGSNSTIKANVRQVVLDVVVTDENGRPVKGLTQEDFSVIENNVAQKIIYFEAHTSAPNSSNLTSFPVPILRPNTFLNVSGTNEQLPLNILLFDALNTPLDDQPYAFQEITRFLNAHPGSRFAIFVLGEKLHLLQGFSDDERRLVAAMSSKEAGLYSSALMRTSGDFVAASDLVTGPFASDPVLKRFSVHAERMDATARDFFQSHRAEQTIAAFMEIARLVNGLPGRKNLIWLSGSFPLGFFSSSNPMNPFGTTISYAPKLRQAANMLAVGQVAVYPVDARGLTSDPAFGARGAGQRAGESSKSSEALLSEHFVMEEIAEDTGGRAFYNTNGLAEAIATSTDHGSNYYSISYSPSDTNFDGRLRKIRVKLPAIGYQLAHRHSYVADDETVVAKRIKNDPAERLQTALIRGAPLAHDLVLGLQIHPVGPPARVTKEQITHLSHFPAFASEKTWKDVQMQKYLVEYAFLGGHFSFERSSDESPFGKFEFQFAAYDADNRPMLGQWTRFDKAYSAEELAEVEKGAYRLKQSLEIPSSAVWLRPVVHDLVGDHIGSIEIPLPLAHETQTNASPSPD